MILPDVNLMVCAFHRDAPGHATAANFLGDVVAGPEELALVDQVLVGFVRVVTNRRIFEEPSPTAAAVSFVEALISAPRTRWLPTTRVVWEAFTRLSAADRQIRGNLVPDAWLAAIATEHGCRLATSDRGFARFPGLDLVDPAT